MEWSRTKDVALCREVLFSEPYQFRERTVQSVQAWQAIIEKLTTSYQTEFDKLTSRGAKEHLGLLIKNYKKKNAAELRASGISPVVTEVDELLEEIVEKMEFYTAENEKEKEKKKREELNAKDVRLRAMENLSQTMKRKEKEGDENRLPKSRRSGSELVGYLRERADEEMALRAKAEEIKQNQISEEVKRHEDFLRILTEQQNQQQQFQQQQVQLHQEAMKQQQQQFQQMQQMMATQQQQNFQMLMAILQKKS